jgi:hypothetical protein
VTIILTGREGHTARIQVYKDEGVRGRCTCGASSRCFGRGVVWWYGLHEEVA